ncbi:MULTISPECIES: hypothetical protein [unclassified Caballeronia]|uniref:hypothetical protein n=1 Tax=unclassified Caballeronia TaxID=2646786 RepID=UPI002028EA7E|nr:MULTISPECIES: hypothetical protein [unclassified Caballeronia]
MLTKSAILDGAFSSQQKEFVKLKIKELGDAKMTSTSHGYREGEERPIIDVAKEGEKRFARTSRESAAIGLMDVVLAANRDYNRAVKPHVDAMRERYKGLTIKQLQSMIAAAGSASEFKKVWGHNDARKFSILRAVVNAFVPLLQEVDNTEHDYHIVSEWAKSAAVITKSDDIIGRIPGIGTATFQHLRMTFGADTVKPDQRVKEVLEREFGLKASDRHAILAVEQMSKIVGYSPLIIDQIFVKYGSGYYYRTRP